MPELPEVETIVVGLREALVGRVIESLDVRLAKTVWLGDVRATGEVEVEQFVALVKGKRVESVDRRAKMIIVGLSDNTCLLIHLKMTGQLIYVDEAEQRIAGGHPTREMMGELPAKSTRVIFKLDKGILYYNDQRQFGYVKVIPSSALAETEPYKSYGPEPMSELFTVDYLERMIKRRSRITIKQLLLDQSVIAGVGNIYADEALFAARIYPARMTSSLTKKEILLLRETIRQVLALGIQYGGTSSEHYVQANGVKGTMQDYLEVYRREGQSCSRCGAEIGKTVVGGRGTHFCPNCQL